MALSVKGRKELLLAKFLFWIKNLNHELILQLASMTNLERETNDN